MDNSLLLQISDSLNLINKSLTSAGGIKPFVPVIAALGGVAVGFALNTGKDYLINRSKNKKYLSCITNEIEIILNESSVSFISLLEIFDLYAKSEIIRFDRNYTPMSYICFEKFFPEVVGKLDKNKSQLISSIYSNAKAVDLYAEKLLNHTSVSDDMDSTKKLCNIVMSLVIRLYLMCKEYLDGIKIDAGNEVLFVADELKVSGPYIENIKASKKKS